MGPYLSEIADPGTPLSLRERAVITLLAHLGLRAGEVIRLKLDDIDWLEGRLIVRAGKNHRERSLPLSQEVGDALVSYLRDARPATLHRELFLRPTPKFLVLECSPKFDAQNLICILGKRSRD
jgi:integrase